MAAANLDDMATLAAGPVEISAFIASRLSGFIGTNIDLVGSQIDDLIDASPYCWRWLEPQTTVSESENLPWRVNVHVTRGHKITRITVG